MVGRVSFLSEFLAPSYYLSPRVDRHLMVVVCLLVLWTPCVGRLGRILRERRASIVLERVGYKVGQLGINRPVVHKT